MRTERFQIILKLKQNVNKTSTSSSSLWLEVNDLRACHNTASPFENRQVINCNITRDFFCLQTETDVIALKTEKKSIFTIITVELRQRKGWTNKQISHIKKLNTYTD